MKYNREQELINEAELYRIDCELIKLEGEFKREVYWKVFPPPPPTIWQKYFSRKLLEHAGAICNKSKRKGKPTTIKFFKSSLGEH